MSKDRVPPNPMVIIADNHCSPIIWPCLGHPPIFDLDSCLVAEKPCPKAKFCVEIWSEKEGEKQKAKPMLALTGKAGFPALPGAGF